MAIAESIAAAAVGWVATPIVTPVINHVFDYVGMNIPQEFAELETNIFPKISLAIKADPQRWNIPELKPWLQRLKEAYYRAEDLSDEAAYQKAKKREEGKNKTLMLRIKSQPIIKALVKFSGKVSKNFTFLSPEKRKLWTQLTQLKHDVKKLVDDTIEFSHLLNNLPGGGMIMNANVTDVPVTTSHPLNKVFGRDEDRDDIVKSLQAGKSSEKNYSVVAIVGIGGAGKTMLAQYVFNSQKVIDDFGMRIWVSLTRKLDIEEHTKQMIQSATSKVSPDLHLDALQEHLMKILHQTEKNILLVLDDVWYNYSNGVQEVENWEQLMLPFQSVGKCSVLLTSRGTQFPKPLDTNNVVDLKDLSKVSLLALFKYYSCKEILGNANLVETVNETITKLSHSPLAVKAVAIRLGKYDTSVWRQVLQSAKLSETTDALIWSFNQLEEPIQRCFLYCSVFPRGFKYTKSTVVKLWRALNMIKSPSDSGISKVGERYFDTLVKSLFFQPTFRTMGEWCYAMHDNFHDLAEQLSKDDCFRIETEEVLDIPSTVCHLTIAVYPNQQHVSNICKLINLRTLIVLLPIDSDVVLEIFRNLKKLRILQLNSLSTDELAKMVPDLKYLKLLWIERASIINQSSESLSQLYLLQALVVQNSESLEVAAHIWVASPIMSSLIANCFSHIGVDEFTAPGYPIVGKLNEIFSMISPFKSVPNDPKIPDELKLWLKRLKDVYYKAEDLLDETIYLRAKLFCKNEENVVQVAVNPELVKLSLLFSAHALNRNVKSLIEEATCFPELLLNLRDTSTIDADASILQGSSSRPLVFGRDDDRENLVQFLLEEGVITNYGIAIVGREGAGKTTLAQYVFSDERMIQHFNIRIWVSLKHELDVIKHTKEVIQSATEKDCPPLSNLQNLQEYLINIIESKKILLVVDDVWYRNKDPKMWEMFLWPFKFSICRTLVTSRLKILPRAFHTRHTIPLKDLEEKELFSLFKHYSRLDELKEPNLHSSFLEIGSEIMAKISRSPLTTKTIAKQLGTRLDINEWRDFLERADLSDTNTLMCTFLQLEEPVQRCFLYCSVLPKGIAFPKKWMLRAWRALNFTKSPDHTREAEDIGERYFNKLLYSLIFQQCYDKSGREFYTIDDSFHSFAEALSRNDCFRIEDYEVRDIPPDVRHLSVAVGNIRQHALKISKLEDLRSLSFLVPIEDYLYLDILNQILPNLKKLRLLEIRGLPDSATHLPDAIGTLKYLRSLHFCFRSYKVKEIPESFCKLYNLQCLVVPESVMVPTQITNLVNLQAIYHYGDNGERKITVYHEESKRLYLVGESNQVAEKSYH